MALTFREVRLRNSRIRQLHLEERYSVSDLAREFSLTETRIEQILREGANGRTVKEA